MERIYNVSVIHPNQRRSTLCSSPHFPCPLPDIREARIDPTLPVDERLRLFAAAIGDPHRFRVGDTEVEVLFDDSAPSLQACLTGMCRQLQ